MKRCGSRFLVLLLLCSISTASTVFAQSRDVRVRIKDITTLRGEHHNVIKGMGLVVGLAGTGATSPSTKQLAMNVLQKMGNRIDPATRENIQRSQEKTNNLSVVIVQAVMPPHLSEGQRIDVMVASYDNAISLSGGLLLTTELIGPDNEVYAIAQGPVSLNGGDFGGNAAKVMKNHPTTGRVPMGATIEREVQSTLIQNDIFQLLISRPQYSTAQRISEAINQYSPGCAAVMTPGCVAVRLPPSAIAEPFRFISECQELMVSPGNTAIVVINERTGTIVVGSDVKLSQVAITHGNLVVSTVETPEVSQPNPLSNGETVVVPRTSVDVSEQGAAMNVIEQNVTVGDLASSLNSLGVSPRDLSSIFQMLKQSGALHAELVLE